MRSKVAKRMLDKSPQSIKDSVSEYSKILVELNALKQDRFNIYLDWTNFSLGVSIMKPDECAGWKLCLGVDIGFISMWVYFGKINN